MPAFTVELAFERHTKNKVVFSNDDFGGVYIPNQQFKDLGRPEALRLTLEPAFAASRLEAVRS